MVETFWTGGPEAYAKALRQECENRLGSLRAKLESAAPGAEQIAIRKAIDEEQAALKRRLANVSQGLF